MNRWDGKLEYGIERDEIGNDSVNDRSIMKYRMKEDLWNLKKSEKKWLGGVILICGRERLMNGDGNGYR